MNVLNGESRGVSGQIEYQQNTLEESHGA